MALPKDPSFVEMTNERHYNSVMVDLRKEVVETSICAVATPSLGRGGSLAIRMYKCATQRKFNRYSVAGCTKEKLIVQGSVKGKAIILLSLHSMLPNFSD